MYARYSTRRPAMLPQEAPIPRPRPQLLPDNAPVPFPRPQSLPDRAPIPYGRPQLLPDEAPLPYGRSQTLPDRYEGQLPWPAPRMPQTTLLPQEAPVPVPTERIAMLPQGADPAPQGRAPVFTPAVPSYTGTQAGPVELPAGTPPPPEGYSLARSDLDGEIAALQGYVADLAREKEARDAMQREIEGHISRMAIPLRHHVGTIEPDPSPPLTNNSFPSRLRSAIRSAIPLAIAGYVGARTLGPAAVIPLAIYLQGRIPRGLPDETRDAILQRALVHYNGFARRDARRAVEWALNEIPLVKVFDKSDPDAGFWKSGYDAYAPKIVPLADAEAGKFAGESLNSPEKQRRWVEENGYGWVAPTMHQYYVPNDPNSLVGRWCRGGHFVYAPYVWHGPDYRRFR